MNNLKNPIVLIIAGVVIIAGAFFYMSRDKRNSSPSAECEIKTEKVVQSTDDEDMLDKIKPGGEVSVEMGYYGCNEPKDNDVVLVQTAGRPDPIIRVVKVVPDDQFKIEKSKDKYNLKVNGSWMENLDGKPYELHESKVMMLRLYEKSLKSKMEPGVYFIFSNRTAGGYDSTRFGPIEKSKLLGKVTLTENK